MNKTKKWVLYTDALLGEVNIDQVEMIDMGPEDRGVYPCQQQMECQDMGSSRLVLYHRIPVPRGRVISITLSEESVVPIFMDPSETIVPSHLRISLYKRNRTVDAVIALFKWNADSMDSEEGFFMVGRGTAHLFFAQAALVFVRNDRTFPEPMELDDPDMKKRLSFETHPDHPKIVMVKFTWTETGHSIEWPTMANCLESFLYKTFSRLDKLADEFEVVDWLGY
jgi:hypothetical protein